MDLARIDDLKTNPASLITVGPAEELTELLDLAAACLRIRAAAAARQAKKRTIPPKPVPPPKAAPASPAARTSVVTVKNNSFDDMRHFKPQFKEKTPAAPLRGKPGSRQ